MCVVCGSFGQGAEGRLLACSQCGQCYHPYCVSIKVNILEFKSVKNILKFDMRIIMLFPFLKISYCLLGSLDICDRI